MPRNRRGGRHRQPRQPHRYKDDRQKKREHATPRADVQLPQGPLVEKGLGVELPDDGQSLNFGFNFTSPTGGGFNAGAQYTGGRTGPSPALFAIIGCLVSTVLIGAGIVAVIEDAPVGVMIAIFSLAAITFGISAWIAIREQVHRPALETPATGGDVIPPAVEINQLAPERRPEPVEDPGKAPS